MLLTCLPRQSRRLSGVQLRDHATPFVGLLASQLTIVGETQGGEPELLGDGGHVQRLMAELHGAQRHRLGWSEADIEREVEILYNEVVRAIRLAVIRARLPTRCRIPPQALHGWGSRLHR